MVPESLIWILSPHCNLSCRHCYTSRFKGKIYPKELYVKTLSEMVELKPSSIGFTGGEPLLFPHIKDLIKTSLGKVPRITVATNGTLIDEAWAEFFAGCGESLHVYISLDGLQNSHDFLRGSGNFKRALHGAKMLFGKGVNLHVMMAIFPKNHTESGEVLKLSHDLGAKTFSMIPVMPSGKAGRSLIPKGFEFLKSVEIALREAEKLCMELDVWCAPFVNKVFKSSFLNAPSCRKMDVVDISPSFEILLCDVIDIKLSNILEEGSFKKALEISRKKERVNPPDLCRSCNAFHSCLGSCYARSLLMKGTLKAPDPLCPFLEKLGGKGYPP